MALLLLPWWLLLLFLWWAEPPTAAPYKGIVLPCIPMLLAWPPPRLLNIPMLLAWPPPKPPRPPLPPAWPPPPPPRLLTATIIFVELVIAVVLALSASYYNIYEVNFLSWFSISFHALSITYILTHPFMNLIFQVIIL